jgi:hypothetical protein
MLLKDGCCQKVERTAATIGGAMRRNEAMGT